ncbi:MAG: hypothetical protein ABJR46_16680 [Tateyamaria sp.]|uniref:hypothetical protein n=1 Tax=Tateyamaria sp. TaxID=1929288 RepID=UPI00329FE8C0
MKIEDLLDRTSDENYVHLERFVNDGSPTGFTEVNKVSPETDPFTGAERFSLLEFDDTSFECEVIGQNKGYLTQSSNFAHPDSIDSLILEGAGAQLNESSLLVSPVAGSRTMLVRDASVGSCYLKLTYDMSRIGRVDRQLSREHCISSVEVSNELKGAADRGQLSSRVGILLEPTARVTYLHGDHGRYEWGTIERERWAYPYSNVKNPTTLIPSFSLFGTDRKAPSDKKLIVQIIEWSGDSPEKYLLNLLEVIADGYWSIVHANAFHVECHAQNSLFEFDADFRVKRLVIKDMDSVEKDAPLAEHLGINTTWQSKHLTMDTDIYYYPIRASYMYDFKLGYYLLEPMISEVSRAFSLDVSAIDKKLRTYVQERWLHGLPQNYFPSDGCWYRADNTERKPGTRRKYLAQPKPRFR